MKQIVDKLNKIAKKIDENVDIPDSDLIIDSLDAITKAYGGTPNNSNLIVDKLEDIAGVVSKGGGEPQPSFYIPEQTVTTVLDEDWGGYLATITTNFDMDNLPDSIILTVNNEPVALQYSNIQHGFVSEVDDNYGIIFDDVLNSWVFATYTAETTGEYTIYSAEPVTPDFIICNAVFRLGNYGLETSLPIFDDMSATPYISAVAGELSNGTYRFVIPKDGFLATDLIPTSAGLVMEFEGNIEPREQQGLYIITGDFTVSLGSPK